jgi:hypothetical protein
MKPVVLALGVALLGTLAACDTYDGGYRSTGISGSSAPYGAYDSRYGNYDGRYGASDYDRRVSRGLATACNPRNVPPGERATILHQDRPGGSDCPDAMTAPIR